MIEYTDSALGRGAMSFIDAFILMLVLGALSHTFHTSWAHWLALSYWQALLIQWASVCLFPGNEYPVGIKRRPFLQRFNDIRKSERGKSDDDIN